MTTEDQNTPPEGAVLRPIQPEFIKAMAKVSLAIKEMPKSGRNDFHGYDYIRACDVHDVLRPLMADAGIAMFPSVVEHETVRVEGGRKPQWRTTLELDVTWTDGASFVTTRWVGVGEDAGDKSYYKAYTGALKYALLKTFNIGEAGADPEASHPDEQPDPDALVGRVITLLSEVTGDEMVAAFGQVAALAVTKGAKDRLVDLRPASLQGLIARLEQHEGKARAAYIEKIVEEQGNGG